MQVLGVHGEQARPTVRHREEDTNGEKASGNQDKHAQGIAPAEAGWSGWLGRYQAALARAAGSIQRDALKERHR